MKRELIVCMNNIIICHFLQEMLLSTQKQFDEKAAEHCTIEEQ